MADLKLEILNNKDKFPDDRVITMGDGEQVTCKEFRDFYQPRADFTRASEGWKRREQELQGEVERTSQAVQGLQAQLQEAMQHAQQAAPPPPAGGAATIETLFADAYVGPPLKALYDEVQSARRELAEQKATLKTHEDYVLTKEYNGQLNDYGQKYNSRYNTDGKGEGWNQKDFLDYAIRTRTPDLDVAYKAYTREQEASVREREAEARGLEKGKATIVPHVPFGRRRGPVKPEGIPESFQDVTEDTLLNDPDIQQAMDKDLSG